MTMEIRETFSVTLMLCCVQVSVLKMSVELNNVQMTLRPYERIFVLIVLY